MYCYVWRKAGPDIAGKSEFVMNVTCHNSYYISPICIYFDIIINPLNEAEDT
jgi:hypothetical protein